MNKHLSMPATGLQAVPLSVVMITCVASAALVTTFWLGWAIWLVAILVALAWFPLFGLMTRTISRDSRYLGFFFILVVTQGGHFIEHLAQMIQIYILSIPAMEAHGLIGTLDIEWVHFIWNSWVLIYGIFLLYLMVAPGRNNGRRKQSPDPSKDEITITVNEPRSRFLASLEPRHRIGPKNSIAAQLPLVSKKMRV